MPAAAESGRQRAVHDEEGGTRGGHVRGCDVHHVQGVAERSDDEGNGGHRPVSYTHLTLPTILLV